MHSFISIARRFHVVSFTLTLVCFVALALCWQTPAMGQDANEEEATAIVSADVNNGSPGSQETEATTKTDNKQNKNKDGNSDKSTQNQGWSWDGLLQYIYGNKLTIIGIAISFFSIIFLILKIYNYFPSRRRQKLENCINDIDKLKIMVLECLRLPCYYNKNGSLQGKIDFISQDKAEKIVQHILEKYTGEKYAPPKKIHERLWSWFFPKYVPLSEEDAYLIVFASDAYSKDALENQLDIHRKIVCDIYEKRYRDYWKQWRKTIMWWFFLTELLPAILILLNKMGVFLL